MWEGGEIFGTYMCIKPLPNLAKIKTDTALCALSKLPHLISPKFIRSPKYTQMYNVHALVHTM